MKKQSAQNLFSTDHLNMDINKKSLKGGAVTVTSQALSFLIQMLSTMVIARILTPEDYGIMAMVFAVTGFATILSNMGLSTATVQLAEINQAQVSNLFWINTGMGVFVTAVVASLSPLIAWFYKVPELKLIVLALSITFFISGLGIQHRALLSRQMQFYVLAKIEILSLISGIIVAIILAYKGYGYWALVANSISSALANTVGTWVAVRWLPWLPQWKTDVRSLLKFGTDIVSFNVINYFARNLDNVLIGRFHGATELGLYSKAYQLLMMPITNLRDPMARVAIPGLSRLQYEPDQYRDYYINYVSILAFVSMPIVVFAFACSDQIITLLLGPNWLSASGLFKILAFAALIQPVGTSWGLVLISTGQSRRYFHWGVINSIITILAFACGLPWGAKGISACYAIATYVLLYPSLTYCFKNTPVKPIDFTRAIWKPLVASFIMGISCVFLVALLHDKMHNLLLITTIFLAGIVVYIISIFIVYGSSHELNNLYNNCKLLLHKK